MFGWHQRCDSPLCNKRISLTYLEKLPVVDPFQRSISLLSLPQAFSNLCSHLHHLRASQGWKHEFAKHTKKDQIAEAVFFFSSFAMCACDYTPDSLDEHLERTSDLPEW